MVQIYINNKIFSEQYLNTYNDIVEFITKNTNLKHEELYLECNGKCLQNDHNEIILSKVNCQIRVLGGKGGFGSMLRAIGAQIEKTTNREACRDLSGRRLRDINEEKRLKAWLEKKADREQEIEVRKQKKIEKLLAEPKFEFKDEQYQENRSKLTEKVSDALEEGLNSESQNCGPSTSNKNLKRKAITTSAVAKKKSSLWISDDISDGTDESSDEDVNEHKNAIKVS